MNKWNVWYNSLSQNTRDCLEKQAIWTDRDIVKFSAVTFLVGLTLGLVF
jgi:hypothetical protein